MALTATYANDLSRVRIAVTALSAGTATKIQRSTDGIRWETVRGGSIASGVTTTNMDDYEFVPGVVNQYRAVNSSTQTGSVTPTLTDVWLKFPAAPFLNRKVRLVGIGEFERQSRSGVFEVSARRDPVVVTDFHSSRSTTINIRTTSLSERDALDDVLSVGRVMLIHMPANAILPSMYVVPGDYSFSRPAQYSKVSVFEIPIREVAKPGPGVVGFTSNYQTVLSTYTTYSTLLAANASYQSMNELIGSATDIIAS